MLLFKPYHVYPLCAGIKTETRRFWKKCRVKVGSTHVCRLHPFREESEFGQLTVLTVSRKPIGMMTEQDCYNEGGYTRETYLATLEEINKRRVLHTDVPWVVRFRFMKSDAIDANGGTVEIDAYRLLWEEHMEKMNARTHDR